MKEKTHRTIEELKKLPSGPGAWKRIIETPRHRASYSATTTKQANRLRLEGIDDVISIDRKYNCVIAAGIPMRARDGMRQGSPLCAG